MYLHFLTFKNWKILEGFEEEVDQIYDKSIPHCTAKCNVLWLRGHVKKKRVGVDMAFIKEYILLCHKMLMSVSLYLVSFILRSI